MLIAAAPGEDEDEKGLPFQGKAGGLLEDVLRIAGLDPNSLHMTNMTMCFPGDTIVEAKSTEKAYKRFYSGRVIKIRWGVGNELTGTPNHPILTSKGWAPLQELKVGDQLVYRSGAERGVPGDPNVEEAPTSFKNLFGTLSKSSRSRRVQGMDMDFHGDGAADEIHVVPADRILGVERDAPTGSEVLERLPGDVTLVSVTCVEESEFRGHVYNLQTAEGWYTAQGVVVSNCRAPEGRDPFRPEIDTCKERLYEQIRLVDPMLILAAGRLAAQNLTGNRTLAVTKERGNIFDVEFPGLYGPYVVPVMAMIHPAALLRNPDMNEGGDLSDTIKDFQQAAHIVRLAREEWSRT